MSASAPKMVVEKRREANEASGVFGKGPRSVLSSLRARVHGVDSAMEPRRPGPFRNRTGVSGLSGDQTHERIGLRNSGR